MKQNLWHDSKFVLKIRWKIYFGKHGKKKNEMLFSLLFSYINDFYFIIYTFFASYTKMYK